MAQPSSDDEFGGDDVQLGSQEEESLQALEASYATQHAAGPSKAAAATNKSTTAGASSSKGGAAPPPALLAKQPLPRGQLQQARALESLQEEDDEPPVAANGKKKEILLPSSPPQASFQGGFEPGDPWSMPHGTDAMRSMYLGLPSPPLQDSSPRPAAAAAGANNRRGRDESNDAGPAAKRAKLAPIARPFKRVTSLPAAPVAPHTSSHRRAAAPAPLPGPDEIVISRAARADELDIDSIGEGEEELWGNEENMRKMEEDAVRISQRVFGRSQSGGNLGSSTAAAGRASQVSAPAVGNLREERRIAPPAAAAAAAAAAAVTARKQVNGVNGASGKGEVTEMAAIKKQLQELQEHLSTRDAQIKEVQAAKQRAEGEVATVRRKAAGLEARVVDLERSKSESEREARVERERLLKEMHEERQAAESSAAFGQIHTATGRAWTAGGSVKRRAPTSVVRGEAGPSASAARKAGLTTPTRKGRGGAEAQLRSSGGRSEETSPSQRKGARLGMGKTPKPQPGIPFARLHNSFALGAPTPARKGSARSSVAPDTHARDRNGASSSSLSQDKDSQPELQPDQASPVAAAAGQAQAVVYDQLKWSDPRARHAEARATYARRRQALLSLMLSHTPSWAVARSYPSPSSATAAEADEPAARTLQRLLTATLPSWTSNEAKSQFERSKPRLLALLSSSDDAAFRFAFLAQPNQHVNGQGGAQTQAQLARDGAEEEFWAAEEACEEGLGELLEGVAATLRSLLQCFFVARMHERIMDVLSLIATLCYTHAAFVQAILAPESAADLALNSAGGGGGGPSESTQVGLLQTQAAGTSPRANALAWLVVQLVKLEPGEEAKSPDEAAGAESQNMEEAGATTGWKISAEAREDLLACIVDVLEALAWVVLEHEFARLRTIFESSGIKATLLSAQRRPDTIRRFVGVLMQLGNKYPNSLGALVSCPLDKAQQRQLGPRIAQSRTPLFDILASHLVDTQRLANAPLEAHRIHVDIVVLLSQLAVRYADMALIIAESSAVLCALVRRLHEDTAAIWHDDGVGIDGVSIKLDHIVTRICMSVRLLAQLYTYPVRPPNLMKRLASDECNAIYNGARHAYILALGRTAFSPEPEWVDAENVKRMESVTALAVSLSEIVLNPEEIDSVWTLCAAPEEDEEHAQPGGGGGGGGAAQDESQTLEEEDELASQPIVQRRRAQGEGQSAKGKGAAVAAVGRKGQESLGMDAESAIVLDEDEDEDAEEAMRG